MKLLNFLPEDANEEDANSDCSRESGNVDATIFGELDDNLTGSKSDELSSDNVTSDIEAEYENPARRKTQFDRRRNVYAVSSIETALDDENYEPIDYSRVATENVAIP